MYFIYKNRSSEDFGLKIVRINNLSSPNRSVTTERILGRNGDIVKDNGNFENFELSIECDIKSDLVDKTLNEVSKELKFWLQKDCTYDKLIISDNDDEYYEAIYINSLDIERVAKKFGEVLLKFNCKPFKKSINTNKITLTQSKNIYNDGFKSEPYIKIFGNGDITIKINTQELILKNIEDEIEIDSEIYNAYKIDKFTNKMVNENNKMYSEFPVLEEGRNNISWTGDVTKLEITPRWRTL